MFLQNRSAGGQRIMTSASDLTAASKCEFAFLRRVDEKLGRDVRVPPDDDPMLARAARLGDAHEERVLAEYRTVLGEGSVGARGGVVEIARCDPRDEAELIRAAETTLQALQGSAEVVFQATFFDPAQSPADDGIGRLEVGFLGFADFLQRSAGGAYEVQDAKLARRARVTALMQLAAYAEQLERLGLPVTDEGVLILGDGARSAHRIADIAPVFRSRRARLHRLLQERVGSVGADGRRESAAPVAWGADDVAVCGRCEVCLPEIERTRDPLLVAGIRRTQRDALVAAGIDTVDAVAELASSAPGADDASGLSSGGDESGGRGHAVEGLTDAALGRLALQARLQLVAVPGEAPPVRVVDPSALAAIPPPNPGDLFFDFEGDPMYREPGGTSSARWGLDYLFGMVDASERFTAMWAHDLAAERQALLDFLSYVSARRVEHPGMRIYHYAAYERTHLLSIAVKHGVGEAEVDELLREHVLVDLYPIVRRALRIGTRSYSIKKLEPLYMGDELRDEAGVTNAAQSVTEYADAMGLLSSEAPAERDAGRRRLDAIADYNRYDCVSTLRLRDWLLGIAATEGVAPHRPETVTEEPAPPVELSPVAAALAEQARGAEPDAGRAAALAAAAVDYHAREQKAFWWAHFARLVDPIEDWADTRDVLIVDPRRSAVESDWHMPPRARTPRRRLSLRGEIAPGSRFREGGEAYLLYEHPAPFAQPGSAPGARGTRRVRISQVLPDGLVVDETSGGAPAYDELPVALAPGPPPPAGAQKGAIEEWGAAFAEELERGRIPRDPVVDLLRRAAPSIAGPDGAEGLVPPDSSAALAAADGDAEARTIGAVVASLTRLDRSFVAVQGPPGTGKTYLAACVIKRLVEERGWRVGVVAQSHKVVENVLSGVVAAGLSAERVGKTPQTGAAVETAREPAYTVLPKNGHRTFLDAHREAGRGCVIGGTAWDFSNAARIERRGLDLLVIDEAGQFSLAPTIAASVAAERLLLLGDPQQLPQVSQGSHPEPIDTSALGWLLEGHETIPSPLGYFLAETRRMRPELGDIVSELAYDGRLHSHPSASARTAIGAGPSGLVWHPVAHHGNATHSTEEAAVVVELAKRLLHGSLEVVETSGSERGKSRPIGPADIVVVAPYNAHVECIAEALAAAGLSEIRVGTVDKFQGQEALFAIVSLAASSPDDVPRGLEFLLMRNRLNVAISRAQWAAHLVSSDRLGDGLPATPEGLAALSGYLRLLERAARADSLEAW